MPARELEAGNVLVLADGREAVLLANTPEDAPPGGLFTTFNFEVADYHTYFVGEEGVWVHNSGIPDDVCDKLRTFFRIRKEQGVTHLVAYEDAALLMARHSDGVVARATKKISDYIYKEFLDGNAPLSELPTHAWFKGFLSKKSTKHKGLPQAVINDPALVGTYDGIAANELVRFGVEADGVTLVKGMEAFESHHVSPKYLQKKLQAALGKTWDVDAVPAVLETRPDHWFPNGLHSFISAKGIHWNQMENFANDAAGAAEILDRLEGAYRDANRLDLVKAIQEWRATIE